MYETITDNTPVDHEQPRNTKTEWPYSGQACTWTLNSKSNGRAISSPCLSIKSCGEDQMKKTIGAM